MKATKNSNWLFLSAALLGIPVIAASWWMLQDGRADSSSMAGALPKESISRRGSAETGHRAADRGVTPSESKEIGSQGESAEIREFQDYASSLRTQGVAEQTVRELVASRITAAYEARRTAIRSHTGSAEEKPALRARIDGMNKEQGDLIARLVGAEEKPPGLVPAQEAVAVTPRESIGKAPVMPAVMAGTPPPTVQNDAQLAEWERQREHFVQALGGANQDTSGPDYRKKWIQAQSRADQQFRVLYGDNAYVAHQLQAQRETQLRQQPQPQH